MKVLIVFREGDSENLFVHTLYNGIANLGIDIDCSLDKFWNSDIHYDIIHFQWPEEVVGWNCNDMSIVDKLEKRIGHYTSQGSKIIYTRHNICPHYSNTAISKAYEIIESRSDIIVHMGKFSMEEFKSKYPFSHNVIILHHIYENTYNENISSEEARKKLNIKFNKFVITAFGKFRNIGETRMVIDSFIRVRLKDKFLLAPRIFPFHPKPQNSNIYKKLTSWVGYNVGIPFAKTLNIRGGITEDIVPNDDLPLYLSASNLIFIQRYQILNSGNLPMAFLFKKVVIGPDVGNVGEILRVTGNPVFNPSETKSIVEAIKQGYELEKAGHGLENYRYAKKHFGLIMICMQYVDCYKNLLKNE